MAFREFEQAIVSPALKHVAAHWNEARGERNMPAWSDIKPARIVAELPIIWCYTYDRANDSFTGRLAGDQIERIFGKAFRGLPMTEAYPESDYQRLFNRSKRVVNELAFYRGEGTVFRHINHLGYGERIMMPLAADGVLGDALLGVTDYKYVNNIGFVPGPDIEQWFSL